MQVVFLGTGTSGGVPLIGCQCHVCKSTNPRDKRLRTSALIRTAQITLVIDCGPDFRQQMLREDIRNVDAILMTHPHKDHTGGVDDIRSFNFINGKPVNFYCDYPTELGIKEQYSYAFTETDYPYLPKMNFVRVTDEPFRVADLLITPIEVMHANMPVKGFKFQEDGSHTSFTYITDAKTIAPAEREKFRHSTVLVLNALRETEHYSHFTIGQAIEVANDVQARQTYFTHMSHQFGLYTEMENKLPAGIRIAYDGLRIEV
jgi:phosphoribosyl 1,2-cyclic phosphate phosphodiesterase